jgi:serine/threonine protein kinase
LISYGADYIKVYGQPVTDKVVYIVSELAVNGEAFDFVQASKGLDERTSRRLFSQIVSGVDHLHKKGYAHRDLKLQNFMLDGQCELKIGDFGMVKCFEQEKLSTKLGTEEYMAPELLSEDSRPYLGPPADIFALGVNLFIIHTARFPFQNCLKDWFYSKF